MNKIFKVIWNHASQSWVAVSELQRAKGKTKSLSTTLTAVASALLMATGAQAATVINPTSGNTVTNSDGTVMYAISGSATNAQDSVVIGNKASASKIESVVIGKNAKSESAMGIAIGHNASAKRENYAVPPGAKDSAAEIYGDLKAGNATAIGSDAVASGEAAIAIGHKNEAKGISSVALGRYVKANHRNTVGIGFNTTSIGDSSVAVGTKASASGDYTVAMGDRVSASGYSAIGFGAKSKAVGDFGISIGNEAESLAEGAIVMGASASAAETADRSVVIGVVADARSDSSVAIGRSAYVAKNSAQSVALGYDANAKAIETLSIGSKTNVSSEAAVALGSHIDIAAGFNESVALGSKSAVRAATKENTATVNGFTYSGFQGEENLTNGRVVAMGNATHARQVINVAPGKIASDSTDAINGSQLYLVADTLGNIAKATATHLGGGSKVAGNNITAPTYNIYTANVGGGNSNNVFENKPANNVGDGFSALNKYINQGIRITDQKGDVQGVLTPGDILQFVDGKNTKANITKEAGCITKITFDVDLAATPGPNLEKVALTVDGGKVQLPKVGDEDKLVNAKTIAETINNSSWKVGKLADATGFTFNNDNVDDVKAGDEVRIADGNFTKVSVGKKQGDDTVSAFKVDVDAQKVVDAAQRPVVYTDSKGNKVVKAGDKFVKVNAQGEPTTEEVKPEEVVASLNDANNKTDKPMTLANVKSTLPGTNDNPGDPMASQDKRELPDFTGDKAKNLQNAATVDDVLNAGFNVRGAKSTDGAVEDVDFVKAYDTIEFLDGKATDMIVTNEDNKVTKIKVDVKTDNTTVKVGDDGKLTAITSVINPIENKPAGTVNKFTPVTETALVTAKTVADVADKILKEGLDFTGNDTDNVIHRDLGTKLTIKGEKNDATDTSGKNLYVTTDTKNHALVVKFSEKPEFKELKLADENKAPVTFNVTGDKDATPELTLNGGNNAPVAIKNVAAGAKTLDGTHRGDKDTANASTKFDADPAGLQPKLKEAYKGLADLNGSPATNAFTVADAKNLGWVVSATGNDYADDVRHAHEVRFVGKNAAKVTGETDANGVRTITVDVSETQPAQQPVVYTDASGKKLKKATDGSFYPEDVEFDEAGNPKDPTTAAQKKVAPADVIASLNNGEDKTDVPMSLANLKGNLPDTYSSLKDKAGQATQPTTAQTVPDQFNPDHADFNKHLLNNAATVGDVLNAGWNLQGNGKAKDFVKPFDTVNFVDGVGTTVEIEASSDGKVNTIKVNTVTAYTDANGNLLKKANDGKYYKPDQLEENGEPKANEKPVDNPQVNLVNVDGTATNPTVLGNVAQGTNTIADKLGDDGKPLVKVGDKFYAQDQFVDGKLKEGAVETANGTDVTTPSDKAKAGLADLTHSNPTNVMTVADAKNLGWVISADKEDGKDTPYAADVRNANEVKFTGKNGVDVVGSTKDGVREIAISLKEGDVVPGNEFTNPDTGDTLVKVDDKFYKKDDIDPTTGKPKEGANEVPLTDEQKGKLVNNGKNFVTGNKVAEAIQKSGWHVGLADASAATEAFANEDNHLTADKLEKVNPNDNVRFTNGKGSTAKLATVKKIDADGTVVTDTFMKFDVDLPITYSAEDDAGNPLVKANDGKWYQPDQVNPDGTLKDPANAVAKDPKDGSIGAKLTDNNPNTADYDVKDPIILGMVKFMKDNPQATPEEIAAERDKLVAANPEAKDTVVKGTGGVNLNNVAWAEKPDQAVNKDQLDQTVAKSGFFVKQNGESTLEANKGEKADEKTEKVTPNDVLDFVNGTNTSVSVKTEREAGRDVTKVRVDVTGLPVTYTDKDGNKVAKAPDGSYYKVDPTTGLPKVGADGNPDPASKVENGDVIASMVNPADPNSTTTPTTLTNVAQGAGTLDGAKDDKGNPLVKVDDKYYNRDQFDPATGKLKAGEEANNVTPTTPASPDSPFNGLASLDNAKPSNVMTVADAKNLGWVISADKQADKDAPYSDDVRNASEVKFTGGTGIEVTGKTIDNIREINISLKKGEIIPTDVKDKEGNTLVKVGDDYYKAEDIDTNGKPKQNATPVDPKDVVKTDNAGDGFVTGNQVGDAIRNSGFVVGKATEVPAADKFENKDERVNPNDELRYADGKNTHVKLATVEKVDASGTTVTVTTVKVDSDLPIDFKFTDAKGKEYAKANDGKFYEKEAVNPDGSLKDPASNPVALEPAEVAKLTKGAQLTNGINKDGVDNKPYEAKDPIQLAVQKAVAETLTANPDASPEEIANAVAKAKADAIKAEPMAKDTIKAGEGGVNLNNVAWAEKPDQAVNKDQLDQTVNKSGFFVKQNGKSTLADNADATEDAKTEKVTPNDVVNFVDGGNLLAKAQTKRDEATGQDVTEVSYHVTGLPITYTAKDGTPVTKVGDKFFKVNKDGYPVGDAVDVNELATNLVNPSAKPNEMGAPAVLGNVASGTNTIADKLGDDGKALVQVGEGPEAKFYVADQFVNGVLKPDAKEASSPTPVSTPVDKAKAGLADLKNSNPNHALSVADAKKLGFVVAVKDKVAGDYAEDVRTADVVEFSSGNDLAVVSGVTRPDGVREVKVTVSKDPAFNTVRVGGNDGPKMSATPEGDLILNKKDGSPVRIKNVAKGVDPNDAVNVSQLRDEVGKAVDGAVSQKFGDINGRINKVDKNMRAGIAGANAAAGLPQVYLPGKSMVAASAGTFKGQGAVAVGYSRASDNGKMILKLQGNGNTRGDFGASVGIGYQW